MFSTQFQVKVVMLHRQVCGAMGAWNGPWFVLGRTTGSVRSSWPVRRIVILSTVCVIHPEILCFDI